MELDGDADGLAGGDFQHPLLVTWRGDLNLDLQVGFDDFLLFSRSFGQANASWGDGDLDADGIVGFSDFLILSAAFGKSYY